MAAPQHAGSPKVVSPWGELMLHISVNILTIQVLAIASTQPPQNCWPPVAMEWYRRTKPPSSSPLGYCSGHQPVVTSDTTAGRTRP